MSILPDLQSKSHPTNLSCHDQFLPSCQVLPSCPSSFYSIPNNLSHSQRGSIAENNSGKSSPISQIFVSILHLGDSQNDGTSEAVISQFVVISQIPQLLPSNAEQEVAGVQGSLRYEVGDEDKNAIEVEEIRPEEGSCQSNDYLDASEEYSESELQSESEYESEYELESESQSSSDEGSAQESRRRRSNKSVKISKNNAANSRFNCSKKGPKDTRRQYQHAQSSCSEEPRESSTQLDKQSLQSFHGLACSRKNAQLGKVHLKQRQIKKTKKNPTKQRQKPTSQHYSVFNSIEHYFN